MGDIVKFRTDCPAVGELMMRSTADFPQRHQDIQKQFDQLFGGERGKFEALLRGALADPQCCQVDTGIHGLSIKITRVVNQVIDLSNRPIHYP